MKHKIGERIRKARMLSGLSQQNIADELGLTVASYSNIERGVTDITVSRLYQLATLFNVGIYFFLEENETVLKVNDLEPNYQRISNSEKNINQLLEKHTTEIEWLKNKMLSIENEIISLR
jgi:transcriptional regulator with XRE-family HTH domain